MQTFKNKVPQRVLSVLSLVALIVCMDWGIGETLEPITYATYFNHDIEEMEDSGHDADVLFVGASRVYRTFVPQIFEDKWNVNGVINAGSSSQPICGTYYQLKDLIERVHPGRVYIGVTIEQLTTDPEEDLQGRLIVYDRLSLKNKFLMGLNGFSLSEKRYLFDTYRFKDRFDKKTIISNLDAKKELAVSDYCSYSEDSEYYADMGFVYSYNTYATGTIPITTAPGDFSDDLILADCLHYLDLCIDLCRKNNIDVNLVSGVTSVMRMYNSDGYQAAVDFYQEYASSKGIKYYNLNYLKNREEIVPDELMHDYNHVNGEGAYVVSDIFADIVLKEEAGEDISNYFYNNLDEFKKVVKRIVAVGAEIQEDSEKNNVFHIHMQSLQNDNIKPIYRVLIKHSASDSFEVISGWTSNPDIEIEVAEEAGYVIRVEAGANDGSYGVASQEYAY